MSDSRRFPAEWEYQSAILMAWPHAGTDWAVRLESTRLCFARIAAAISRRQTLLLLASDATVEADARTALAQSDADLALLATWLRSQWGHASSPITPEFVGKVRATDAGRPGPWSAKSLEAASSIDGGT